jgi:hypothetical protein
MSSKQALAPEVRTLMTGVAMDHLQARGHGQESAVHACDGVGWNGERSTRCARANRTAADHCGTRTGRRVAMSVKPQ